MSNLNKIKLKQIDADFFEIVSGVGYQIFINKDEAFGYNSIFTLRTGDQNISGIKNFISRPTVSGSTVALREDLIDFYNFHSTYDTSIVSGDFFINYFYSNSTGGTTTLPSVYDKAKFFIKNLGSGKLRLTAEAKIENNDSIFIYPNESIEIFGISRVSFTGWVVNSAFAGI